MQNSLLLTAFQSLTGDEIKAFRKFAHSPFFNQRKDVQDLFEILAEGRKARKTMPGKEGVSKQLYPHEPFDDRKVRHAMSFLFRLLEQYFAHTIASENEVANRSRLAEAYRRRNLTGHTQRALRQAADLHAKSPLRSADHLWLGHEIQRQEYLLSATARRSANLNIQQLGDQLDRAFLALKLRQSCLALSHLAVFKTEYDHGLLPQVLAEVERRQLLDEPAIGVYYHCFHAFTQPEVERHFQAFKKMLHQSDHAFPVSEGRDLYLLAINFCIRRYNEGEEKFLAEEFELYRAALEKKLLLVNGMLSRFTYKNVATLGLVLREFDWTETFIHEFRPFLQTASRKSYFTYNLARLAYFRKDFPQAMTLLAEVGTDDLLLNIDARIVLLKIYYETSELNALDSHLDAMANFVRRKKELSYHRENYLSLCRFVRRLLAVPPHDREALKKLKTEMESAPAVAERKWLLEKVGEG